MSAAPAKKPTPPLEMRKASSLKSATVLPFSRPSLDAPATSSREATAFLRRYTLHDVESLIRVAVDTAVAEHFAAYVTRQEQAFSSPFDAIYISRLVPDPIDYDARERIARFADIEDLSPHLIIADGLDD